MSVHIERQGDIVIVMPKGPLDGGVLTGELETALRKLIYDDQKKIVLDLDETTRVSSIGFGILIAAHISADNRKARLHLCNIDKRIKDTLAILKLLRVFHCFDTRQDVLDAFEEQPAPRR